MDPEALLMSVEQQISLFGQIQTSQTVGQPYRDTCPYGECSLHSNSRLNKSSTFWGHWGPPYRSVVDVINNFWRKSGKSRFPLKPKHQE